MSESNIIETLSTLPVEALNDIRLMAAILRNLETNKRHDLWVKRANNALEWKQAQALRGLDDTEYDTLYQNAQ